MALVSPVDRAYPAYVSSDAPNPPASSPVSVPSTRTFPEALADLIPEGLSLRALAERTRHDGGGMSAAHLSRLMRGLDPPTVAAMEALAEALEADPEYFAEYRLAAGRALLDEHGPGGLAGALDRLEHLQAHANGPLPRPPAKRARLAA